MNGMNDKRALTRACNEFEIVDSSCLERKQNSVLQTFLLRVGHPVYEDFHAAFTL